MRIWLVFKIWILQLLGHDHGKSYHDAVGKWLCYCPYCHKHYDSAVDVARHLFKEHKEKFQVG
jgi:hypothetical protein